MRVGRRLGAGLAALALAAPWGARAASAVTAGSVELGAVGFGSIVVDDARQHVLVSAPAANEVLVFDESGSLLATIPDEPGARGMVIDGSTLYVAQSTAGAIDQINLDTLTDAGALVTGLVDPVWLAVAGGRLWTAVGGTNAWDELASITLTGTTTVFPTPTYYSADVTSSPGDPNGLYVAEDGLSPGAIYRLNVASGVPVALVKNTATDQGNIEQLAVSPDGTRVLPASGYPYELEELSPATLTADGVVYPGQPYPSAVAVSAGDGGLVALGLDNGYSSPDISLFPLGQTAPILTATTTNSSGTANVVPHGLALDAAGTVLFAVTADDVYASSFTLHVLRFRTATTTTLSTSANPVVVSQPVTFTAMVAGSSPTGTVTFSDGSTVLATVALAGGHASYTTSGLAVGAHQVTAAYGGDSANGPSSAQLVETVSPASSQTSLTASPNPVKHGRTVKLVATVTVTPAAVVPTGTVTFSAGSTALGTMVLTGGRATLSTSALPVGSDVVTAVYSGSVNVTGSRGQVTEAVTK